ncbi:MAG TPA: hypothetical protein VFN02_12890 [Ktedonobacteraceae bacterium]|nr:hypothetical protein [Ktedonobacteraceae bacterium]
MKKHHMLRTVLLSTVFALLTIVLLTPAASAHATVPAHVAATCQVPTVVPCVNIVIKHGKAVFSPTVVHCKACIFIAITNLTNVTQKVLFGGKMFIAIPPGFVTFINPSELGTHFVGLKSNPHARLTVLSS